MPPSAPREGGGVRVLALSSSPRGDGESRTALLLAALVEGLREGGAEVEVVALRSRKIRGCTGCHSCWTKTPGLCAIEDDMTAELLPKWLAADVAVYATPLYNFSVSAAMKAFVERTLPAFEPFLERRGARTLHPLRGRIPGAVVLSTAGFPEPESFAPLSSWAHALFRERLIAEICRPSSELLGRGSAGEWREVLEAVRCAGREIVRLGRVEPATAARIGRDLLAPDDMRRLANLMWSSCIAEGLTPREFRARGRPPRPETIPGFLLVMRSGFEASRFPGGTVLLQLEFTGTQSGTCHLRMTGAGLEAGEGRAEPPDLTVRAPFELWMDVLAGRTDGQQAFLAGGFTASGELGILMRMREWFGGRASDPVPTAPGG